MIQRLLLSLSILFAIPLQAQTDTLDAFFKSNQSAILASPNGGWVSGTNGYGDREKMQAFVGTTASGGYSVLGALVWIGKRDIQSGSPENSRTWLKVRRLDITTLTSAPFIRGPQECLDSAAFTLAQLDSGMNYLPLQQPLLMQTPFTVGLTVFEELQNDTLAIWHSADDSVSSAGQSWELYNGAFRRMVDSWGLNIDFAIFPVIDTTLNALPSFDKSRQLKVFPNPSSQMTHLTWEPTEGDAQIRIIDLNGRLCYQEKRKGGEGQCTLPSSLLANGLYLIQLQTLEGAAHQILQVQH